MRFVLLFPAALAACAPAGADHAALTAADRAALDALHEAFSAAWLAGDSAGVLATLTPDAVMIPHWGDDPVIGLEAIRTFWWPPDAPPARVDQFRMHPEEVDGAGDLAYARGRYALAFTWDGRRHATAGNYLMLFRRTPEGWRISHRIWNDPPL